MSRYSKESYVALIRLARGHGFRFVRFGDPGGDGTIYLRHDVDYSLSVALELAKLNAAEGVSGMFFVMLRSPTYNLLSSSGLEHAREIHGLGQQLGIHLVVPDPPPTDTAVKAAVHRDYELLLGELPELCTVVSWHNPGPTFPTQAERLSLEGLVNIYTDPALMAAEYLSDSNMYHRPSEFAAAIARRPTSLHLLFHPFYWVVGGETMGEVLAGTWGRIIRDSEEEFRENRSYSQLLPGGVPGSIVEDFVEAVREAAGG
jgi:hypothetical protein